MGLDVVQSTSQAMNQVLAQQARSPGLSETQLLISYRGSAWVGDDRVDAAEAALAAGDRAPDAAGLRRTFVQQPFRLHERLGRGRHVLLGCVDGGKAMLDALAQLGLVLRETLGAAASVCAIAPATADIAPSEALPKLIDASGEFAADYNARPGGVWLIRPDGHVGWCNDSPSVAGLQSFLERCVRSPSLGVFSADEHLLNE